MAHVVDVERVEVVAYHLKKVCRTLFDYISRDEDVPRLCWTCFEEAFLGCFFPC